MSNFLAGVVRRGAGLSSPIAVRPAFGPHLFPQQIPTPNGMAQTSTGSAAEAETAPQPASQATPPAFRVPADTVEPPEKTTQGLVPAAVLPPPVHTRIDPAPPVAVSPPDLSMTQPVSNSDEAMRILQPRSPAAIIPAAEAPRRGSSADSFPVQPEHAPRILPADTPSAGRADAFPKRSEQKPDAILVPTPVHNQPPAAASPAGADKRQTAEPRSVQVKIGKVEIRSTPPPSVTPAARPPVRGGFDDLALTRNYLDRGAR